MTAPLNAVPAAIPPESARNEGSRRELQAKLAGLGDLGGKKISPEAKAKKLREACEGFESVFIQKMWQEMRNTLPKNGLLHGRDEQYWQDMYDQELSKSMTSAGGIGLADMMYEQLSRNLVSASRGTVGSGRGASFTPTAAPLLQAAPKTPEAPAVADAAPSAAQPLQAAVRGDAVPSVYDGAAPQSGGMDRQAAASQMAAAADNGADARSGEAALSNPEVERALAALRAQQALTSPPQGRVEAVPAGQGVRRQQASSGLELAQMAQREAGDKLGPGAVRPPLRHPARTDGALLQNAAFTQNAPSQHVQVAAPSTQSMGQPTGQSAMPVGTPAAAQAAMSFAEAIPGAPLASAAQSGAMSAPQAQGQGRNPAQVGDAAPQTRTVRYTTNIPQKGRTRRGQDLIRTLNTDGTGPGSRAGAGLAAYHAAQAQTQPQPAQDAAQSSAQSSARTVAPAAAQAANPATAQAAAQPAPHAEGQTVPPLTARSAENRNASGNGAANSFAIPPLTAGDLRG